MNVERLIVDVFVQVRSGVSGAGRGCRIECWRRAAWTFTQETTAQHVWIHATLHTLQRRSGQHG